MKIKKFNDLSGQRFGRLIVEKWDEEKSGKYTDGTWRTHFICICDCGKRKSFRAESLKGNHAKSCGCLQKEIAAINGKAKKLPDGIKNANNVLQNYKSRAKKFGLPFTILDEDFLNTTQKECHYCGAAPSNLKRNAYDPQDIHVYNGIDRIDSSKGYEYGNVVPACRTCNIAKSDLSYEEFLTWLQKAATFIQNNAYNF